MHAKKPTFSEVFLSSHTLSVNALEINTDRDQASMTCIRSKNSPFLPQIEIQIGIFGIVRKGIAQHRAQSHTIIQQTGNANQSHIHKSKVT